jgi:hypothetical protein
MAILGRYTQQPAEVLDYEFSFADWLTDRDDTLASYTIAAAALDGGTGELTISDDSIVATGVVRFFASGGTSLERYLVTCTITTDGGRVKESEVVIRVKEV